RRALLLVVLPLAPVAFTRNSGPLSANVVGGVGEVTAVPPGILVNLPPGDCFCHWYVAPLGSLSSTLKVALLPAMTAAFAGCVTTVSGPLLCVPLMRILSIH